MADSHTLESSSTIRLHTRKAGPSQCWFVGAPTGPGQSLAATTEIYTQIGQVLARENLQIVHERIFGTIAASKDILSARRWALQAAGIPADGCLTYAEGGPVWGEGLAGIIIRAVSARCSVTTIMHAGEPCGRKWTAEGAEFIILQDMHSRCISDPASKQTSTLIEQASAILAANGMSFSDVQRTWFYLNDILAWYGDFNQARTALYTKYGIVPAPGDQTRRLPASTGIAVRNPRGAAGTMDIFALKAAPESPITTARLANPVQNEAPTYGSSFSRAAVVRQKDFSLIQVSGTAAIDGAGKSLYPDDAASQIVCTFDKIEALIAQEKAGLGDICAATVFVKRPEFAADFQKLCAERGLIDLPCVCVVADVCRPELLFEIDAEAAV